jgi:hypothetical protein
MRSKLLIGGLAAVVAFLLATSPVIAQAAGFITSGDIVNNTIKSKDVKDNNLKGKDVKDSSLTGTDITDGSVTGGDIADGGVAATDLAPGVQSRLAIQPTLGSMPTSSSDVNLGDVALTTGGKPGTNQLVKIDVYMQLDHDTALGTACGASWRLTRDASNTSLSSWSQELYNGAAAEEHNIVFTFTTTQAAVTTSTYHILGSNSCTQDLFTDEDIVTAEAFPLTGAGAAPARAGAVQPSSGDNR